jgi:hypothetical protein
LYKDNLFSSPEIFNDLTKKKKQEGHIREPKAQESQTQMSGHLSEDQDDLTAIQ